LDGEIGKFLSQNWSESLAKPDTTAWQNWSDMSKIGSATVHVNGALRHREAKTSNLNIPLFALIEQRILDTNAGKNSLKLPQMPN
jgi:hypothetical protein